MSNIGLVAVFVIAYAAITFEHGLRINKSASALVGGGLLWVLFAMSGADPAPMLAGLEESLAGTAQIVFFLMGAMTIVEVIDAHDGFTGHHLAHKDTLIHDAAFG